MRAFNLMSLNLTNLETYVHNFSLDKIKILSFILLALKLGLARKRINFYFFNCSAEFLTFSPEIISFWKKFLEGNHVSSFIFSKSLSIFSYFYDPLSFDYPSLAFHFSLLFLSPISFHLFLILSFRSSFFSIPHRLLSIILFRSIDLEVGRNRTNTFHLSRSNLNF